MKLRLLPASCCLLFAFVSSVPAAEPLLYLSDQLQQITGKRIELHASPGAYADRSLSLICEALLSAFREAAVNSETRATLNRVVRSIVIEEFYTVNEAPQVDLSNEVLTVQSLNSDEAARAVEPLVLQVLRRAGMKLR